VYVHHPIRSAGRHGDTPHLAEKLLPLLADRAQVYLAGHDHDMQQLAAESGVHFLVAGSGGAGVRPIEADERSLFASSTHGFAVLEISEARLHVEFVGTDLETLHRYTIE